MRKVLLGAVLLLGLLAGAATLIVRTVFTSDDLRRTITAELSRMAGVPVTAARLSARAFPGLRVTLHEVAVQTEPPLHANRVELHASLLTLLTRRLDVRALDSVHIVDAQIATRGRTLHADAVLAPKEGAVTIRQATIAADEMRMTIEGELTHRDEMAGNLTVRASTIDADLLLAAVAQLTGNDHPREPIDPEPAAEASADPAAGGVHVDIETPRLSLGPLSLTGFDAQATVRRRELMLEPVAFGGFGGHYKGQIAVRLADGEPSVRWYGDLENIDLSQALAAAGAADTLTGILSGDVDLTGVGTDFSKALKSVRGSARLEIANGAVKKLGIVRVLMTAGSSRPQEAAQNPSGAADTPFQTLATTLTVSGGSASLVELQAESPDLSLEGGGGLRLDGSVITVFATVKLSPEVSQQIAAGRGRALEPGARLEVPATIRGNTNRYSVEVDMAQMTVAH